MKHIRVLPAWTLLLVAVVLQGSLAGQMRVLGYIPDLILLTVLSLSLTGGPAPGAAFGFAGGALHGILVGESPGSFLVSRTAAAVLLGVVGLRLFRDNRLAPLALLFVGTLAAEFVFFLMTPTAGFRHCLRLAFAEGVWNVVLGSVFYPLARRWLIR